MNDTTAPEPAPDYRGTATYCPEDNKLRLYVGRVPRGDYLKLRADGWKALHKQREAGGGDFVAIWTPERRDLAVEWCGIIEDEDMGPAERAADRAERFAGYREKRTGEACERADRYDAGPTAHGFQSQARAERSAARHDRIADRAGDAWDKAEYWQRRTAGVISHALHVAAPSVRMGRIKELEADIRKAEKSRDEYAKAREIWQRIAAETDIEKQNTNALRMAGGASDYWCKYQHPRQPEKKDCLWDLMHADRCNGDAITGAEAAALYLSKHSELTAEGPWLTHYRNRLAYENQMLEAQGGRAGVVEMVPGGWLRGGRHLGAEERQVVKVNKSPATGRVVSVLVRDNHPSAVNHYGNPFPDGVTKVLSHTVEVERMAPDAYRAPTAEELAAFEAGEKAAKKARKASAPEPCPLINPTEQDAEKLQAIWNAGNYYKNRAADSTVLRCTFAQYDGRGSVVTVCETGQERSRYGKNLTRCDVFKVRAAQGDNYGARRVVVLADKPQKPLPWSRLEAAKAAQPTAETVRARMTELRAILADRSYRQFTKEERALLSDAEYVGFIDLTCSAPEWKDAGIAALREVQAETANV